MGQFDLLNFIVNQEPPGLKDDEVVKWGEGVKEVVKLWCVPSNPLKSTLHSNLKED